MKKAWMTVCVVALAALAIGLAGCSERREMPQTEGSTNVQETAASDEGTAQEKMDYSSLSREELVNKLNETMKRMDAQMEALQKRSDEEAKSLREKLAQQRDKLKSAVDDLAEASDEQLDEMQKKTGEQLQKVADWLKESAEDDG